MSEQDPYSDILEICDCCHDYFDLFQVRIDEYGNIYCDKCLGEYKEAENKNE